MDSISLNEVLEKLDFDVQSSSSTLFFTSKKSHLNNIKFEERLVLNTAKKLNASAVYFRRFSDNQSSKPQLFIFDNTDNRFSKDDLAQIHKKIWSGGIVPIYYVFDKTTINIFDAREQVKYDRETKKISVSPFDVLPLVSESFKKYSAKLFANGTFWEQNSFKNHFLSKESSENKLIEGLKSVRSDFIAKSCIEASLANKLLVLSILVKYLEERKDETGKHVFPSNYFSKYDGVSSFCDVLRNGRIVELFEDLSGHFNGKIFELDAMAKAVLGQTKLNNLADYLDADKDGNQLVMWPLYSFDYLPVELISRIYEEFIPQRKDAVYTPIHLARLMVDECMPISEPKSDYKIIDVSCGSGVFLVAVFKRLVQWWQKERFDETGQVVAPELEDLKYILLNSIHGVDIEEASVQLSAFSLSIALCDMLTPTEIWMDLRFDDLRENNIYFGNFFKFLKETEKERFDLVIGNPPFEDKMQDFDKMISDYDVKIDYHIPRNQIAMLFLQQAMKLLVPGGLISFVMPSGPLLYNNTLDFRKEFFTKYEVPQIIDLSSLNRKSLLFERAISTAVIFALNKKPKKKYSVAHIVIKRNKATKEKMFFDIDYYDIFLVPQDIAKSDSLIWKVNLLGGDRLYSFVRRVKTIKTFGEHLKGKKDKDGWIYGEGYNVGNKSKLAPHLTGKLMVETASFTEKNGISETKIEEEVLFEGIREKNKLIFKSPHLLLKETPGEKKFVISSLDYDLIFKHEIIGIHAPNDFNGLKRIESTLQKNYKLLKMLLLSFSGRAGISRSSSTVLMKDFMSLPFPEHGDMLELSFSEEVIQNDVLEFKLEELSKGEKAKMNTQFVLDKELQEFGQVFCKSLNPIYEDDGRSFRAEKPIKTLSYTCFPFVYGTKEYSPEIPEKIREGDLSELLENQQESVHYRRILRLYQKDIVYLVKPHALRYWLKSVALRDASDVMVDLVNSGY